MAEKVKIAFAPKPETWGEHHKMCCKDCFYYTPVNFTQGSCHKNSPRPYMAILDPRTMVPLPVAMMIPSVPPNFGCGDFSRPFVGDVGEYKES